MEVCTLRFVTIRGSVTSNTRGNSQSPTFSGSPSPWPTTACANCTDLSNTRERLAQYTGSALADLFFCYRTDLVPGIPDRSSSKINLLYFRRVRGFGHVLVLLERTVDTWPQRTGFKISLTKYP